MKRKTSNEKIDPTVLALEIQFESLKKDQQKKT